MSVDEPCRVLIVGPCGAGKSTLAFRLAELLDLPLVHLDKLNWRPGWVVASDEQFRARLSDAVNGERWLIDGNYSGSLDVRLPRADCVILLDLPRWRCMWNVIKRIVRYNGEIRPDMGEGCAEKLDWEFLEYVWNFHDESRPRLLKRLTTMSPHQTLITLRSEHEVNDFVDRVRAEKKILRDMY